MKRSILFFAIMTGAFLGQFFKGQAQVTPNRNTVIKTTVTVPQVTTVSQVSALTADQRRQTVGYFDGLGRPQQTITVQGSPDKQDIIQPIAYDEFGREVTKYLPYVGGAGGGFHASPYTEQRTFYSTASGIAHDDYPYSQTILERSPRNLVVETGAAGSSWQPGNGHTIKVYNGANSAAEHVKRWVVVNDLPVVAGEFAALDLSKVVTTDEHGHQIVEYKDRENKVILKKVQLDQTIDSSYSGWLSTFYVYDDFNNLRFVIPPKAVNLGISNGWNLSTDVLNGLCFQYSYDERLRMVTKKVPGAGTEEMVYDSRDRLAFRRDGNMRANQQWMVYYYDELNREVMTALWSNAGQSRADLQTAMNNSVPAAGTITTTFPGKRDLVLASYDGSPFYKATNSITLEAGFETGENSAATFEIDPNWSEGVQSTVVYNPSPTVPQNQLTYLTYTFYDDYSYVGAHGKETADLAALQPGSGDYENFSPFTKGLVTGTKVRVMGTDDWITTTTYYNGNSKPLQVIAGTLTGGRTVTTNLYDFEGKVLKTYSHLRNPRSAEVPELKTLSVMTYDHNGQLLTLQKQVVDKTPLVTIAQHSYNALGQLSEKVLGNSLDNLKYDYNIRGWLTSMNKGYLSGGEEHYFGFDLGYDNASSGLNGTAYSTPQFNGNISGSIWKSKGAGINRKYDYSYDNVNRLTGAAFLQQNPGSTAWASDQVNFTVNNISYDENGNLLSMDQQGLIGGVSGYVDRLRYGMLENSNQLKYVTDQANNPGSTLGDFKEVHNNTDQDYWYDQNGNLKQDGNKGITSIIYNHLNLPEQITIPGKGTITYQYDATGMKHRKVVVDQTQGSAKTVVSDYINGYLYIDNKLVEFAHEEGRVRAIYTEGQPVGYAFDYFEKDHLGNIRVVLTDRTQTSTYAATMETARAATEVQLFSNIEETRAEVPAGYPAAARTSDNKFVARLAAREGGKKIGPSLVLRVMAGDTVRIGAQAFYKSDGPKEKSNYRGEDMLADLALAFGGSADGNRGHGAATSQGNSPFNSNFYNNDYSRLKEKDPNQNRPDKPKAYLNYVLFDDNFRMVDNNSGVRQVKGEPDALQTLTVDEMPVEKSGYLYVYTSNETAQDVYFDNLFVNLDAGPLLEETHYYPFGLTMAEISANALVGKNYPENRLKYNGKELQNKEFGDGSGL